MAATDYTGMVARWMDALATDAADTEFTARLPALIGDSELRICRDLDPIDLRRMDYPAAMLTGFRQVTLPADCWLLRRVSLLNTATKVRTTLRLRSASYLQAYTPDLDTTGAPKYWTRQTDSVIALSPAPVSGFSLLLDYSARPNPLTPANPTNWLTANVPDLLYAAGMLWLAGWSKNYDGNDKAAAGYWQAQYDALLAKAQAEEASKKTGAA